MDAVAFECTHITIITTAAAKGRFFSDSFNARNENKIKKEKKKIIRLEIKKKKQKEFIIAGKIKKENWMKVQGS